MTEQTGMIGKICVVIKMCVKRAYGVNVRLPNPASNAKDDWYKERLYTSDSIMGMNNHV